MSSESSDVKQPDAGAALNRTQDSEIARLFSGGGELGALMAAKDWAQTPLGPVETWPQNLRTCVRIVLTSRQPMFVWWGEDLINLYNDAYKSIVGGKHPKCLGQPARVVWSEIWDQVAPRVNTAIRDNKATISAIWNNGKVRGGLLRALVLIGALGLIYFDAQRKASQSPAAAAPPVSNIQPVEPECPCN